MGLSAGLCCRHGFRRVAFCTFGDFPLFLVGFGHLANHEDVANAMLRVRHVSIVGMLGSTGSAESSILALAVL